MRLRKSDWKVIRGHISRGEYSKKEYDNAVKDMAKKHGGLVRFVSRKYIRKDTSVEDAIQSGYIGLLEAIKKFDPDREIEFSTYAFYHIRRHVIMDIFKDQQINIPLCRNQTFMEIAKIDRESMLLYGKKSSISELSLRTGETENVIRSMISATNVLSLDQSTKYGEKSSTIGEIITNQSYTKTEEDILFSMTYDEVMQKINLLKDERSIDIIMRYHFGKEESMKAIGDSMNLSRSRVQQIYWRAINEVRSSM